ncbi:MAG: DUF1697 domain-containing protein [Blastocatellia bacterium]|nr:DUF1697 domain-containing protein [Blastocatellia bacterium]
MFCYIAFLRAINIGGRRVKMDYLRQLFESFSFSNVATFIASGNVIFHTEIDDKKMLESKIENRLREALGYEVATFVRTNKELNKIVSHRVFEQFDSGLVKTLNVAFLSQKLDRELEQKLNLLKSDIDDLILEEQEIYWLCSKNQSESKFTNSILEKRLNLQATIRSATTVKKIDALIRNAS